MINCIFQHKCTPINTDKSEELNFLFKKQKIF